MVWKTGLVWRSRKWDPGNRTQKIMQKSSQSWHSTLPITQHVNETLVTLQNRNYFTKRVSTYSFSGLIYNGSSLVKEEVDQNVIWDGLVLLPCFF